MFSCQKGAMPGFRTRLFQFYWRLARPMTLGVRGVVEDASGQVLLVRHTYVPGWHLPGGGVEKGEPCIDALRRELAEEGGVVLQETPTLLGVYSNHLSFPNDHVLLYRVSWGQWTESPPTATHEIAELRWADPLSPPDGTTPATVLRLREIYDGLDLSPYWNTGVTA